MKIGIIGGSFNPIHKGHIYIANIALEKLSLDKVIFVPTKSTDPHLKPNKINIDNSTRLNTIRKKIDKYSNFELSTIDIERDSEYTYTIDTLEELNKLYPNDSLFFITGVDTMNNFDKWKMFQELPKLATFIAISRPGYTPNEICKKYATLIEVPGIDISSTKLRSSY